MAKLTISVSSLEAMLFGVSAGAEAGGFTITDIGMSASGDSISIEVEGPAVAAHSGGEIKAQYAKADGLGGGQVVVFTGFAKKGE